MSGMLEEIDSWMRVVWLKIVKKEYDNGRILVESNLHSTVYPVRNNAPLLPPGQRPLWAGGCSRVRF
jgi:hypothetical protein